MKKRFLRAAKAAYTKRSNTISAFGCAFVLTFSSGNVNAEDIEIYTGVIAGATGSAPTDPDFKPNVLFILDNSTSMGSTEPIYRGFVDTSDDDDDGDGDVDDSCSVDLTAYDPSFDYTFGQNTGDQNIYVYFNLSQSNFSGKVISPAQNQCQYFLDNVDTATDTTPFVEDEIIQFGRNPNNNNRYSWDANISRMDNDDASAVECQRDRGAHGHTRLNTGDTNPRNSFRERFNPNVGEHYFSNASFGQNPYTRGGGAIDMVAANYHHFVQLREGNTSAPPSCLSGGGSSAGPSSDITGISPEDLLALPIETSLEASCGGAPEDRNPFTGFSPFKNTMFRLADSTNPDRFDVYQCVTRLDTMKLALSNVLKDEKGINAGLMRFNLNLSNATSGSTLTSAITDLGVDANRNNLISEINRIEFGQATPIAESMFEAYRYLSGGNIAFGFRTPSAGSNQHATFNIDGNDTSTLPRTPYSTDSRAFAAGSTSRYASPITTQCQPTSIVLLSDGAPSVDEDADSAIRTLTRDFSCDSDNNASSPNCAIAMSRYLNNNDIAPSSIVNRDVTTYTIGFNLSSDLLRNIAAAGAPDNPGPNNGYFEASDTSGLEIAFRSILSNIDSVEADLFSAPAVTVNAFNRLQNREDIYYALFKPETHTRWEGNVKKYRVNSDAEIVDASTPEQSAIGGDGFFVDSAKSFWSEDPDGGVVADGGSGGEIAYPRKLFGNINGSVRPLSSSTPAEAVQQFLRETVNSEINVSVNSTGNFIGPVNIPFGLGTPIGVDLGAAPIIGETVLENQAKIAAWSLGLDIDRERDSTLTIPSNQYVGDSLHGTPYVLSFGGTETQPDDVVFYTTNQGMLHAILGDTGKELWSYIPDEELFSNLGTYYNRSSAEKLYGLDSEIAFNVVRDPDTQDVVVAQLFFGQRRGGSKLFAVDVSDALKTGVTPFSPMWTIAANDPSFARLGQTWAEPVVSTINYCTENNPQKCSEENSASPRSVLFVSGGYDEFYDDPTNTIASAAENVLGNAIYVIDSQTGAVLWMVSNDRNNVLDPDRDLVIPEMDHSIVSKPTVVDTDGDGAADTIFATDIAGQIFRIDFRTNSADTDDISSRDNSDSKESNGDVYSSVSGGVIADLSEPGTNRRFYNSIDATIVVRNTSNDVGLDVRGVSYLLTTASGYRAHPLDPEAFGNRIYFIYDDAVDEPAPDLSNPIDSNGDGVELSRPLYTKVDSGSLTSLNFRNTGTTNNQLELSGSIRDSFPGSFINLPDSGEKIISPGVINNGRLLSVSYIPADSNASNLADKCEAGLGTSRVYSIDLGTGQTIVETLSRPGITASPVILFIAGQITGVDGSTVEGLKPIVIIGTEPFAGEDLGIEVPGVGKANRKMWWESTRARQ